MQRRTVRTRTAVLAVGCLALAGLAGCTNSDSGSAGTVAPTDPGGTPDTRTDGTIDLQVTDADRCDPIAEGCLKPFPDDYFTVADETTPTGRRVALDKASMPINASGVPIDPMHWNELDGFSPSAAVLLEIPDVDLEASGAAPVTDPSRSLDETSPVVLLDTTTGKSLAHWVELDATVEDGAVPTLFVRPAAALPEGHRIVVAIRGMVDTDGSAIEPTDAFRAYRDRLKSNVTEVEARRSAMEQVFSDLDGAGIGRDDLQMAWDFTVASAEALSGRMLHIRDDAFAEIDAALPSFTVEADEPSTDDGIARRVTGTFEVPSYLTGTGEPGSEFVLGDDGLPTRTGTYTANFRCIVPTAATAAKPASAGLYGHGLLGTADQVGAASAVAAADDRIFCATDLIGMAEEDTGNAAAIVGELSAFNTLADRLQQGHLNTLVLGRLMISPDGFGTDAAFQDAGTSLLTDDLIYYGISQGGIMGAATTAVAQDWTRAVLGVPAANYGLLLDRSVDFDDFRAILDPAYPAAADRAMGLQLIQMLWDRGEAAGYEQHLTSDPYTDTPAHTVLLQAAFGDHQVANVATAVEARTIGASMVRPALTDGRSPEKDVFWDVPGIESYPFEGSAVVMYDSGAETPPVENVPPREGEDPHGDPRADPEAIEQIVEFLRTGTVVDVCDAKPCTAAPR